MSSIKARFFFFILVDLWDFFFRPSVRGAGGGGGGSKKIKKALKMTSFFFFPEILIFLFFFQSFFFFNISRKTVKLVLYIKVIFKYFILFLKIWTGQSLLTVSLSKMHRQNLNKILFFSTEQIIFRVVDKIKIFF